MKLNKSKWFVAIIGVFLISLNSCQTEEIALQESEKKVQHIDIDKLFQDSNFNNSFNKIVPKKNKSNQKFSKTIMEEQYGFTIIDQPVSVITNENLISYTLLIDKQNKETAETVYNLVIQVNKQTNEVKSSIIKYISTYPIFNFNDFKGEIKIEPITYNAAQSSKLIYDCIQVTYYVCANANENHVAGGPGCDALPKTKTACGYSNDSSGTSSTNIGSGDLSGGGGSGSFTTAPVINYYYYTPNKNTDGNYLNLTNEQISFINSESVDRLLRKFIIDYYNPEISPEISASQVVDLLKNNQHLLVEINTYIIQNNSLENQDFLLQIINLAITNPDFMNVETAVSPNFKMKIGDKLKYPKFTEYIKNKIPSLSENSFIINKLIQYSQLNENQIKNDLKWNQGPTIKIVQLDNYSGCQTCSPNTYGVFLSNDTNSLYIDFDFIKQLENSATGMKGDTLAFLLGVTLLHEYVHLGDFVDGIDQPGEEGLLFEQATYGESIWIDNAGTVLLKWKK